MIPACDRARGCGPRDRRHRVPTGSAGGGGTGVGTVDGL